MTDTPAVEIHGLAKSFGRTRALDGLDLAVARGQVRGFLGPNGAGKSTTIRVLLGLLRADAGTVRLLDGDPWREAVRLHRRIAYVPGDVTLWPNLTGMQAIDFLARLRGQDTVDTARRDELIERFELDPHKKSRTYSKGNRQKVAIIAAFSTRSELYILDEPTSGLDPLMEQAFAQCVREAVGQGAAVLLSSHILAEVEKLCDAVTIIRAGRTVRSGSLAEMRHLMRTTVSARTRAPADLRAAPYVEDLHTERDRVRFSVDRDDLDRAMTDLTRCGIEDLTVTPASLEDMFLHEYHGAGEKEFNGAGR
ncbi:ABC transporter ATP-binding protein [Mycolicibacterium duvalii]|uniref:ABC transporter ATP-binding protein n=1 Tax=Mycolicibacterium duvalii TaxID=39688 RepID=A0A7I7JVN2_9MYCO|nr:ABC transporter ATP-binding protein [Mycolicibacterium duvalii]MCV7368659.1 ABC transporter ATP-binding protein [Mycolicibacterium duvalii]PEG39602.1 ABC transporter ATP-binding protein [Mycolicibacterium duvalii]BBX15359.1 ABC transporter ATP-binding protein [Mycolicibacterium duvalii]